MLFNNRSGNFIFFYKSRFSTTFHCFSTSTINIHLLKCVKFLFTTRNHLINNFIIRNFIFVVIIIFCLNNFFQYFLSFCTSGTLIEFSCLNNFLINVQFETCSS
uniref:Candidate secreted effector n=1 Tax=Meloidogyne incognita TaxID=6306 RepID=A0A914MNZ7_MELIC